MILQPQLHETSHTYDTGGAYLYRVVWSSEKGYRTLYRRLKPTDPQSRAPLWPKSVEVDSYLDSDEFYPSAAGRPIKKFTHRNEAERIIRDDTIISGIIPKRKVG